MEKRGPKNSRAMRDFVSRRAERVAQWGRDMEQRVSVILQRLLENEALDAFQYHEPSSAEDSTGKDFTVKRGSHVRSFGITISSESQIMSSLKHPDTPQWWFPIGIRDDTIERKVLALFEPSQ